MLSWFTEENLMELLQQFRTLGPLFGILLPFLEALFPFLPLVVFVVANANAFGLWLGFLFSWIGASSGAIVVFLFIRWLGDRKFMGVVRRNKTVKRLMLWVERHGFGPLFLLLCFPFTPSAAVNIVAGLSKISIWQFMLAVFTGKLVMIFLISFIGHDIRSLIDQPERSAFAIIIILVMWIAGKQIEKRMNAKMIEKQKNTSRSGEEE
ncbi:TVP38/TMEM64 family protein [Metabacillus arenae]|uniref:TVP38/TMEM64 family membrane protein n=1 Tax=Metabacillus arenae TaxID=2771434 RepID=A0A926RXF9_9BACI|nr:TVP38/TMEM64 family protein [Metabacillus arenae]MBD1380630.1 TVP38/TMEM64 family protein [Metabacillus arenae]